MGLYQQHDTPVITDNYSRHPGSPVPLSFRPRWGLMAFMVPCSSACPGSPRGDPLGVGDGETAAIEASKPQHIILYWTAPSTETGHLKQVFDLCPVKNCRATWDKSELPRASAVVISRDWASTPGDVASWLPPRRPGQPRIWRLNEPPVEGHMPFSLL
ncbi:hypothetical protein FOZ62_009248, partial [Perkinsus olseni]